MSTVAYRRVSTTDQKTDRQLPDEEFDKDYEEQGKCKGFRPAKAHQIDRVRPGR